MKIKNFIRVALATLVFSILFISCTSCSDRGGDNPTPVKTYTVSFNLNGGSGTVTKQTVNEGNTITLPSSSLNTFYYTGYSFVSWNTSADGTGASYNAGASYKPTGDVILHAIWQKDSPIYTAVINTTTSYEGSTTAVDKVLLGGSIAKGLVLDVTTAGTAKVEVLGTLTSGAPAVSYYWINGADNADINAACSTLNSTVSKTAINSQSFTINLNAGKNVICFKTARYSGLINNGGAVGLKITLASNVTFTTISYTADSVSPNVAAVQKMQYGTSNNKIVLSGMQTTDTTWGNIQLTPYSDEVGTVFDQNLFPKIYSITYDTTSAWCSPYGANGSIAGYSNLDFTNIAGSVGQNFRLADDNILFTNTQSNYSMSGNVLTFNTNSPIQLTKSILGNYDYLKVLLNVYNSGSSQFGPASVSFKYKSVRFLGNPETWIYDVNNNRIQ